MPPDRTQDSGGAANGSGDTPAPVVFAQLTSTGNVALSWGHRSQPSMPSLIYGFDLESRTPYKYITPGRRSAQSAAVRRLSVFRAELLSLSATARFRPLNLAPRRRRHRRRTTDAPAATPSDSRAGRPPPTATRAARGRRRRGGISGGRAPYFVSRFYLFSLKIGSDSAPAALNRALFALVMGAALDANAARQCRARRESRGGGGSARRRCRRGGGERRPARRDGDGAVLNAGSWDRLVLVGRRADL